MRQRSVKREEFKRLQTIEDRLQAIRDAMVDAIMKKYWSEAESGSN
jgi:hypothetical protein